MIGMNLVEGLRTVTSTAAGACHVGDRKGRIAAGFDADLLAVHGDPLTDPAALTRVPAVYRAASASVDITESSEDQPNGTAPGRRILHRRWAEVPVEVCSGEKRRRRVLHQRLLVLVGRHPDHDDIRVAFAGLGSTASGRDVRKNPNDLPPTWNTAF